MLGMLDDMMPYETVFLLIMSLGDPESVTCTAAYSHSGHQLRLLAKCDEDKGDSFASP